MPLTCVIKCVRRTAARINFCAGDTAMMQAHEGAVQTVGPCTVGVAALEAQSGGPTRNVSPNALKSSSRNPP